MNAQVLQIVVVQNVNGRVGSSVHCIVRQEGPTVFVRAPFLLQNYPVHRDTLFGITPTTTLEVRLVKPHPNAPLAKSRRLKVDYGGRVSLWTFGKSSETPVAANNASSDDRLWQAPPSGKVWVERNQGDSAGIIRDGGFVTVMLDCCSKILDKGFKGFIIGPPCLDVWTNH